MAEPAIHTEGLTKLYGRHVGIVDLDIEVQSGEVFGYLGSNGAGKTTTIRTLLDYLRPSRGRARVLGLDSHRDSLAIRRRVGYLPGELALYERLTGRELLRHLASLRGGVDWALVDELTARLGADLDRRTGALSHGNRQKLGLIQAFMHRPDLLILDEPTSGLDPLVQHEFAGMVGEARTQGHTVFLSSHVLSEVEHLCDRVGIIRSGRLVAVEDVGALKARQLRRLDIHFAGPAPAADFAGLPEVRECRADGDELRLVVVGELDAIVKRAAHHHVVTLTSHEPSLEEVFLTFYREGDAHAA